MSEHPSFTFEQAPIHEGTRMEDGTELDLQKSRLGTPEEGRALAEAARMAELIRNPEQQKTYGHEGAVLNTRYVMGIRNAELVGSDTLVLTRDDFDLAA